MGHGAARDSWVQFLANILRILAAASWIGALVAFVLLLRSTTEAAQIVDLKCALRRFSAVGVPLVALLVLSGLVNCWFLVGLDHVANLFTTDYGRLLLIKLVLFAGMLALAALNRNRHTPAIARTHGNPTTIRAVRRSIALEFVLGGGVLAAVAWLGTLAPPAACRPRTC